MSDNIFSAVLTFSLLAGGTAAIGSEMFNVRTTPAAPAATQVVTLPPVTVLAHRDARLEVVTLPTVTITRHRDAAVRLAAQTQASEPRRVQ